MKFLKQVNWLFRNSKTIFTFKKQVAIATCFLIISIFSFGQNNLVPNPGFDEVYNNCPSIFDVSNIYNWYVPNKCTPDGFYYCSSSAFNGILQNTFGYQYPLSDSIYLGFGIYAENSPSREYLQVKLIEPLKKDSHYCCSFYFSLADGVAIATSSVGMLFTIDSIYDTLYCNQIISLPQIQNDSVNIITDKQNWTKISGRFVAKGGEQFLTIGNFYDDNFTIRNSLKVSNSSNKFSYYYIDNVSVYACDSPLVEEPQDTTFIFIPNVFSPNQDGENDLWQVTAQKVNSLNIQVFNRWGEQVYSFNSAQLSTLDIQPSIYNPAWDGYTPTGKPVPEGTYFYIVQYTLPSGETKVEKGNITLIR